MPNSAEIRSCVESIDLAQEKDKRVALARVRLGEVLIRGVAVWRGRNGHLRVFFPTYKQGPLYEDAIQLSDDMRTQVEADVISAYKTASVAVRKAESKERS